MVQTIDSRTDQYQGNNIEVLSKRLELLRITEEDILNETDMKYMDKMSIVPVPIIQNEQIGMLKSIVLDLGQFNRDRVKFEDW